MPLNPPSYKGQDVYHSPDVYVNQVPVALWQTPRSNNVGTDQLTEIMFRGCEIDADGSPESHASALAYQQTMVATGLITQAELDAGRTAAAGMGSSDTTPAATIASFGTDTGGVENIGSYPGTLQLSRNFTLGQLTLAPFVDFPHPVRDFNGLTAGQIVANLKLLAINCLDLTRDKYPDMRITNTFRDNDPPQYLNARNQHPKGQAADLVFRNTSKREYFNIAQWMKNNLPFDQLLLEWRGGRPNPSHWIHISYNPAGNRPRSDQTSVMTFVNDARHSYGLVDLSMNFV